MFVSMKSGNKAYSVRQLRVSELIDHVRRNSSVLFRNSGCAVDFQIQEGLPPIWGDLQALSHCLQNLIGNAVKYSGKSRWIGVTADLCGNGATHSEVRISVTDHGLGIDATDLQRIFEPFYRGQRILAAQIHGTGLGLSVAKHIAEAMGGSLSVTSEINVGSVFTLHLRIAEGFDSNTVAEMARTVTTR